MADKQTKIAPAVSKSWAETQEKAKAQKEIFPKLFDGLAKADEAVFQVEFLQAEPDSIEFPDKFADRKLWKGDKPPMVPGYAINVRNLVTGEPRSIVFRDSSDHGLVRGIATLSKGNGGSLQGVRARIELRNYNHRQFGKTRGYTVSPLAGVGVPPDTPDADELP